MKFRPLGPLLLFISLTLCLTPVFAAETARKSPFFYVLEGEALGGYSEVVGKDGIFSSIDRWLVSPNLKISDSLFSINVYKGSYDRSSQVVSQEEGGREAQTVQSHSLTTALKWLVTEIWSLRPLFFVDWVYIKETADESFGDGLYDYRDLGGGLESTWLLLQSKEKNQEARLGFRTFKREYPNFQSLLSLFDPNSTTEVDEKDFIGYKGNWSLDSANRNGWSWGLEAISLYKDYTDKQTVDANGIRNGDGRKDFLQYLNGSVSHALSPEFRLRLDGQFSVTNSNLDFYDTHNTLTLADDDFVEDYFDTHSFLARPALIVVKPIDKNKNLVLVGSYTFYSQIYSGRRVQNESGVYQSEKEKDFRHTFGLRMDYPLTENISWVATCDYTVATSNQKFETFYLYEYDRWSALTGISIKV